MQRRRAKRSAGTGILLVGEWGARALPLKTDAKDCLNACSWSQEEHNMKPSSRQTRDL